MNRFACPLSVVAILAGGTVALAQVNEASFASHSNKAPASPFGTDALGDSIGCSVNIDALTAEQRNLGVEYAFGYYFLSRSGGFVTGTQVLGQYDADWNLVAEYTQLTTSATWGNRDGAAIESENRLFFGAEAGNLTEYVWNPTTERIDLASSTTGVAPGVTGTVRALAWDPDRSQFYSKDFAGTIFILDRSGSVVNLMPSAISAYGAGYDTDSRTVWFHAYRTGTTGAADAPKTRLAEWDPDTLAETGREFDTDFVGTDVFVGYIPGGGDVDVIGGEIVATVLTQGDPFDFVTQYAITGEGSPCGGACRADLDGDGSLTLFDFLEFQNLFASSDPRADFDGDGSFTIFDFLEFQNAFAAGC